MICSFQANSLHEKQVQKLDQYIMQINTDMTLKHRIEILNLLLTKSYDQNKLKKQNSISSAKMPFKLNSTQSNQEALQSIELDFNQIELYIIDLKKHIAQIITSWNNKLVDFFKKPKHDDVNLRFALI
jgi:hypothetical protein